MSHQWRGSIAYPASDSRVRGIGAGGADDRFEPLRWYLWIGERRMRMHQDTTHPDLEALAPGLDLQAPIGGDRYACWSGSSFAAALYSGYLAANGGAEPSESKSPYPRALFCEPEAT